MILLPSRVAICFVSASILSRQVRNLLLAFFNFLLAFCSIVLLVFCSSFLLAFCLIVLPMFCSILLFASFLAWEILRSSWQSYSLSFCFLCGITLSIFTVMLQHFLNVQFSIPNILHVFLIPSYIYQYNFHVLVCGTYIIYPRIEYIHNIFYLTEDCLLCCAHAFICRM